jgi:hypothetical protein
MAKHEVVNEILEYLDARKQELEQEMFSSNEGDLDYVYIEGSRDTYDHLIAKLEDDYR